MASADGDPTHSIAGGALHGRSERRSAGSPEAEARSADASVTLERLTAVPEEERTLDNPEWVDFLLYDNQGDIRISLRPFFPDTEHAQVIVRLPGNEDIETEGAAAQLVQDEAAKFSFPNVDHGHDRRAGPPAGHQRLPAGRDAHPRRHRRRDHDPDPPASSSTSAGACCRWP